MNKHINLVEILKDCPSGIKLYSMVHGEVEFIGIQTAIKCQIKTRDTSGTWEYFDDNGKLWPTYHDSECILFPSKDQRDWSKFEVPVKRFDPKDFKPFDKVLVRDKSTEKWIPSLYAFLDNDEAVCIPYTYNQCIPYNDDTKHLLGTYDDCPEYYKWWRSI